MTDRRKRIVFRPPWFRRIFASPAMHFIKFLSLSVVGLKIAILQRPFRRDAVTVWKLFKVPLTQTKERRTIDFRVSADKVAETWMDLSTILVIHRFVGVILE